MSSRIRFGCVLAFISVLVAETARVTLPSVGLRPDELAQRLVPEESRWLDLVMTFTECNATTDAHSCSGTSEAFVSSCGIIVNVVMHGSKNDHTAAIKYMANVCSTPVLTGWHRSRCRSLASFVGGAMMAMNNIDDGQSVSSTDICRGFWPHFISETTESVPADAKAEETPRPSAKPEVAAPLMPLAEKTTQVQSKNTLLKKAGAEQAPEVGPEAKTLSSVGLEAFGVAVNTATAVNMAVAWTTKAPQVQVQNEGKDVTLHAKDEAQNWSVTSPGRLRGKQLIDLLSTTRLQGAGSPYVVFASGFAIYLIILGLRALLLLMRKQFQATVDETPADIRFEDVILQNERFSSATDSYMVTLQQKLREVFDPKTMNDPSVLRASFTDKMVFDKMLRSTFVEDEERGARITVGPKDPDTGGRARFEKPHFMLMPLYVPFQVIKNMFKQEEKEEFLRTS